jgi:hypothetical protein
MRMSDDGTMKEGLDPGSGTRGCFLSITSALAVSVLDLRVWNLARRLKRESKMDLERIGGVLGFFIWEFFLLFFYLR